MAVGTRKGLDTVVYACVDVQAALVHKALVALVAGEGAHAGVQLEMLLQVALDGETFAAVGTHEGVAVDVDARVVLL